MSDPRILSTPPGGANLIVDTPSLETLENTRQLAQEVLMDVLAGILFRKGPEEDGMNGTRKRRWKEISVEDQLRAEERRKNLCSKKVRGE